MTKKFFCENGEKLCIEHLISNSKFDLTKVEDINKYLHFTNLRYFSANENNKKRNNIAFEDELRQKYLLYCFRNNIEPSIELKCLYGEEAEQREIKKQLFKSEQMH